ncbi:PHA synthase subunit PhaC [Methylobacterium sp. 4-46]|uniref:alpha/beta fold hydrolase n=1 Tax=unclassified Methylobacterium TaxID=2615210 RepID=UPI000152DA41|nr:MULTISPECIES: alpha/beta fold hydrolase [Methylobacterium]ACA14669.1 PHA synthase subunit PhaC [Methylobacterium sp. 4-46]WFT80423.1 alpha/beta fold hydrolase [Methylobacterium nodulans]
MTAWLDEMRRQTGRMADALGYGPQETPWRSVADLPGAQLRAYHAREREDGPVLLICPAPFKRPYIWDLMPPVSVVRRCLARGLRVYLVAWRDPAAPEDRWGLADYADRIPSEALAAIAAETGGAAPILAGHSLGGTLAAICAARHPGAVAGLVLLDAPLAFGEAGGPLARAAREIPDLAGLRATLGDPVPGSVITALSLQAAPEVFRLQPALDLAACLGDPLALAVHARVARWALDEFALPGPFFEDVLAQLYREDRFLAGTLRVGAHRVGLAGVRAPILAVLNPSGLIVPPESLRRGLAAVAGPPAELLTYEGEPGPMLQHLGPLVGPAAHARLWPGILDWILRRAAAPGAADPA